MADVFVLDAWALLAFLQQEEPAASRVKTLLQNALTDRVQIFISIINLGEVYYRIGKLRGDLDADETLEGIHRLPLTILSAPNETVMAAARFKMRFPVSYADAFAAVTAEQVSAVLLTGDPELLSLTEYLQLEPLHRYGKAGND